VLYSNIWQAKQEKMSLYLDNAATSFPKPAFVVRAVRDALVEIGASPGRGAYRRANLASKVLSDCRAKAARLLGIRDKNRVLFTKNATESINIVLKGWLGPGDRALISAMEHNSVVRPLTRLAAAGVKYETVPCSPRGLLDLDTLAKMLSPPPKLVVLVHASNVNGALQPIQEAARLCAEAGAPLLLDAAQTAGIQPIDANGLGLGMLACSGHKALLGPPGVGLLYVRADLDVLPLMEGGTGSRSEEFVQPEHCPDRFESGTPNLPGIAGVSEGIDFVLGRGVHKILDYELRLAALLEEGLGAMPGVRVIAPEVRGTGAVAFVVDGMNPADVGRLLDEGFGIAVRAGLHCAPLAHQTLGTFPQGTVRVSAGYSTTLDEIHQFLDAMRKLLSRRR
jgi:cysteine desulfurase / selenocysteine lyase